MAEPDDGMGMFADVITGALGVVMFTALFFALRALASNQGIAGVEVNPALRSQLAMYQLEVAQSRREGAENAAAALTVPPLAPPDVELVEQAGVEAVTAARRRDLVRQRHRRTELQILAAAAEQARDEYELRQRNALNDYVAHAGAEPASPVSPTSSRPRPLYAWIKAGRVFPLHDHQDGEMRRNTEHVGWVLYDQGRQMRAYPQSGRGWHGEEAVVALVRRSQTIPAEWQLTLLVSPESYADARELLRELAARGIAARWQPLPNPDYVSLAVEAVPPP